MQLKEEAVFTLKFDGKPVINELGELEQRLNEVKDAQKLVERGTQEWADNKALLKELESSIKAVREEMGVSGMTVRQMEGYYRELNREIKDLTPGTEAYIKKAEQITEVNNALTTHRQTVRGVNDEIEKQPSLWERAKSTALGYLAGFSATELLERAFNFIQGGIKDALELSDMMGGVAKATNQSAEQVEQLAQELDKIDTRTTKESLMDIAQIGGQLGVANDELLGFIKSTDMAAVALGDEFSGGAEEAANTLGGLKKLFAQTDELSYGDAIQKVGSAINELGADGSATGPVIAEFTSRMGQLGDLSPQITQTMGLGAAFQELGLSAEISAGGLSNILLTAAKDTATFAQQLGYTDTEFKKIINTDPNRFLLELAATFKNVPADQLATRLSDLGIKSQEATKVMSLLKDQTEMVTDKQALANKAFQDGTSLQKEFTTMNSTAAAEYEKSQKALTLIATEIGQGLLPAITKGAQGLVTFVNVIRAIPEFVSENKTSFAALGIAVLALNTNLIVATATSIAHAAAEKARLVWTNSATAAQWLLNAAMTANPIGAVVAVVALLVAGFTALYNNSTTVRGVISGLWEVLKTGTGIVGEITTKCLEWLQSAMEPLKPVLETVKSLVSSLWSGISSGVSIIAGIHQAIVNFANNGLASIGTALTPVRSALSSFWSLIDSGIAKIQNIGSAISSFLHVDEIVGKVKSAAGQIGDAFNKGYGDKLAEDQPKQLAAHQQTLDKKKTAEQKGATEMADIVTASDQKALDKKAAQAEKHRQEELKKAAEAAKKEAEEKEKANTDALKKVAEMNIAAIMDDLERERAKIQLKHDNELAAIAQSKASQEVKAVWEKALNQQLIRDMDKAYVDAQVKHEKDEADTAKRILDLKIKLSGDEKTDKLQKLEDVAAAQRIQIAKDITDETQKADMLKQVNDNLIKSKEQIETEYRRKKEADETALQNTLYQATLADANNRLTLAGNNAQAIYDAKKMRLDAEYQYNRQKLLNEAAEEKARNNESIQDTDRRAQANQAIDARLKAELTASDNQYETQKTQLTAEKNEARRQNHQQYFNAIKSLMDGDLTAFTDILNKKIESEKKQLTEKQQKNLDTIDAIGEYTVMATQALQKLSQMKLDKELANIKKEKDTQLAAWKDKYDKGLINKDEYEKQVDVINQEAAAKEKQARLDAFKRQQAMDIASAVINGAQAALKSLAMFGWPIGLVMAAGAAVTAGIQIALIKRQQPPSMAKGGKIRNAGVPDGPGHGSNYGDSGLSITRRDTGEEVAEMEGGEPVMVLSRSTYKNNRGVVDALLNSSLHRNGAPIMRQGGIFSDGGTYGDYLKNGGLRRFDNGGWMDSINSDGSGEGAASGGSDAGSGDGGFDSSIDPTLQSQIDESQATMDGVLKNTEAMVEILKVVNTTLSNMQIQMENQSANDAQNLATVMEGLRTDVVSSLAELGTANGQEFQGLRTETKENFTALLSFFQLEYPTLRTLLGTEFTGLKTSQAQAFTSLETTLHQDVTALSTANKSGFDSLESTLKNELPSLGNGLAEQLDALRLGLIQVLNQFRTGVGQDMTAMSLATKTLIDSLQSGLHDDNVKLQDLTQTELSALQTALHQDLLHLENLVHTDLGLLERSVHTDLSDLAEALNLGNNSLEKTLQTELANLIAVTDEQQNTLRMETRDNFTALQTILGNELDALTMTTHSDLEALQMSNTGELRAIQNLLNSANSESGYQSTLLRIISEKNLSVSVQSFAYVFNQIDVVVNASDFK